MGLETDVQGKQEWQPRSTSIATNGYSPSDPSAARRTPRGLGLSPLQWLRLTQVLRLSGRECDITRLILETLSEEEIAIALSISPHTVHSYCERLYRKTSVKSRMELIIKLFATYIDLSCSASLVFCEVAAERERHPPPSSQLGPGLSCATPAKLPDAQR